MLTWRRCVVGVCVGTGFALVLCWCLRWRCVRVVLVLCRRRVGVALVLLCWRRVGVVFALCWRCAGAALVLLCLRCAGVVLVSRWCCVGVVLSFSKVF